MQVLPFSLALADYQHHRHQERFRNETDCLFCRREMVEDTEYQHWYFSADVENDEPYSFDRITPVTVQNLGVFCSEGCWHDYLSENQMDTEVSA